MRMNLLRVIQMQKVLKYWVATFVTGAFLGAALLSKAETLDTFT
jgi:glycerol uptake facilitator-like aquaporin